MRFPEFTEEWETKKLGNISPLQRGFDLPKQSIVEGNIPIVYSNGILKFHNQSKSKAPGLVTGRSGTIGKLTFIENGEYWPHNTSLWVTDFCGNIPKFIYYLYQTINIEQFSTGSGVPTLNRNDVHRKKCSIPNIEEQKKISSFLSLLDEKLQTQKKTIEELNVFKKGIAKKIFSQQLRFKDDNGNDFPEWENKTLGEVTTLINRRNKNNKKLPVYSINNKLGFVPQSEQFDGVDSEDRGYDIKLYKIIDKNTFAYNPARINVGSIGYSGNLENIIISSLYVCFKTSDSVNDNFLFQYLKTNLFNREVLRNVEGGVRDYLFYENFARIKFALPYFSEQQKIANFLSSIDSKIDIENQILQKLEEQKKYFLANLFI